MYFDIEDQIEKNFTKIDAILQFAKGGRILISTDSNSRSTTWNDIITNPRGKKVGKSNMGAEARGTENNIHGRNLTTNFIWSTSAKKCFG
jgi:hypothetical protein